MNHADYFEIRRLLPSIARNLQTISDLASL